MLYLQLQATTAGREIIFSIHLFHDGSQQRQSEKIPKKLKKLSWIVFPELMNISQSEDKPNFKPVLVDVKLQAGIFCF